MKQTVNLYGFREAFRQAGRGEQFTHEGLEVLFDYLEQYEEDLGEELELDVIGLCCDFSESDYATIAQDYSIDLSDCEDDDDIKEAVEEYLADNTSICGEVAGGFVFQQF